MLALLESGLKNYNLGFVHDGEEWYLVGNDYKSPGFSEVDRGRAEWAAVRYLIENDPEQRAGDGPRGLRCPKCGRIYKVAAWWRRHVVDCPGGGLNG